MPRGVRVMAVSTAKSKVVAKFQWPILNNSSRGVCMGVAAQRICQDKERDALVYLIVRMKVV